MTSPMMSTIPAVPVSWDELPVNSWQGRCTCWWAPSSASFCTVLWVGGPPHSQHVCVGEWESSGRWGGSHCYWQIRGLTQFIRQISSTNYLSIHHSSVLFFPRAAGTQTSQESFKVSWKLIDSVFLSWCCFCIHSFKSKSNWFLDCGESHPQILLKAVKQFVLLSAYYSKSVTNRFMQNIFLAKSSNCTVLNEHLWAPATCQRLNLTIILKVSLIY